MDAFFIPLGDNRFQPTEHTVGPWSPDSQHGGPPSALLSRAIQAAGEHTDFHVARLTFEILGPVPTTPLTVTAEVVRPGRSVELVEASLSSETHEVMKARAWRIKETGPHSLDEVVPPSQQPPGPDQGEDLPKFNDTGYLNAMDTSFIAGSFVEKGPATAWFRMRYPLIAGEEPSPLTRVLMAVDSGSGISAAIDWAKFMFINPDLTVYLHRLPRGEWVCMDGVTTPGENGVGIAMTTLFDLEGQIGHGIQSLFIAPHA